MNTFSSFFPKKVTEKWQCWLVKCPHFSKSDIFRAKRYVKLTILLCHKINRIPRAGHPTTTTQKRKIDLLTFCWPGRFLTHQSFFNKQFIIFYFHLFRILIEIFRSPCSQWYWFRCFIYFPDLSEIPDEYLLWLINTYSNWLIFTPINQYLLSFINIYYHSSIFYLIDQYLVSFINSYFDWWILTLIDQYLL